MEPAFGDEDTGAGVDLFGMGGARVILDHLRAGAFKDEDYLLGAGVVVAGMALAGGQGDNGGGKLLRPVHPGAKDNRQVAPVEAEAIDIAGGAEQVFHIGQGVILLRVSP